MESAGTKKDSGGIRVGRMVLGPVQTNCYYLFREDPDATEAAAPIPVVLVDPPDQGERIYDTLSDRGFAIEKILLTHAHFDHIGGIRGILARTAENKAEALLPPVACPEEERPLCEDSSLNCSDSMGFDPITIRPDLWLKDEEIFDSAGIRFRMIATPGHTAGSCCFYVEEAGILISGDTLFQGSVGRTDLPTGSMHTLIRSIRDKLLVLPDETLVLPGHGDATTIADEKRYNSFL